jgi:hypothetical protein
MCTSPLRAVVLYAAAILSHCTPICLCIEIDHRPGRGAWSVDAGPSVECAPPASKDEAFDFVRWKRTDPHSDLGIYKLQYDRNA